MHLQRPLPNPVNRSAAPTRRPLRPFSRSTLIFLSAATVVGAASGQQSGPDGSDPQPCVEDREALLALDQDAFDQDLDGGWRPIAARPECVEAAADLIAEYRRRRLVELRQVAGEPNASGAAQPPAEAASESEPADTGETIPSRLHILFWHEAQLRALAEQSDRALELFRRSYSSESDPTWRAYAEATVAFLEGDLESLEAARDRLAALPQPTDFDEQVREMRERFDYELRWPPNLDVVDGLVRCFEEPYSKAYGSECREP